MSTPGSPTPTLVTDRLVLRAFTEADLPAYTAILQHPAVRASLALPDDIDEHDAWSQMASFVGQWALRGTGQWAVAGRVTGRLLGRTGTHHPHRADWPGVEVGWTFHPDHWGRGYATEAGRAAVDWAFATLDVDRLHSMIRPSNTASSAVARRLGFTAGETRRYAWFPEGDHTDWVLTRADWGRTAHRAAPDQ